MAQIKPMPVHIREYYKAMKEAYTQKKDEVLKEREELISEVEVLQQDIMERHNLKENEVLYIGDDINDISAMELVKYRVAPRNLNPVLGFKVPNLQVCENYGGSGAIREIADILVELS